VCRSLSTQENHHPQPSLPDHPIQVILDPHVQTAIFLIGGAIIAALILFVLILADMTPINQGQRQ
jgi:hypothetical protein